jgi:ribonuclease BN (tRNA processing enzyme)
VSGQLVRPGQVAGDPPWEDGDLTVTILGCDGSYPGPGGACSGYLVNSEGYHLWIDCGVGSLAAIQLHIPIEEIDAVVITHEHPDHWGDLEHLGVACRWMIERSPLPVYAQDGLASMFRIRGAVEAFDWHLLDETSEIDLGPMGLSFSRTDHPVPTLAVRVDASGRSLGYSADSGPGWGLSSLGEGLDLVLCEATFLSDKEGTVQHMSARQAGLTAAEADVRRLVVTHVGPRVDKEAVRAEASLAFGRPVTMASAGARYAV